MRQDLAKGINCAMLVPPDTGNSVDSIDFTG